MLDAEMEFYDVVKTRRSVRSYRQEMPPEEALGRVMEAVRLAPSGSNRQPWRFITVTDPGKKDEIMEACNGQRFVAEAPMAVVACGKSTGYDRGGYMGDLSFIMDVSIAFTHLIMAARAEGLGTCWLGDFENSKIKPLLGVPDDWDVVAVTPLGYPSGDTFVETDRRKPISEIVSRERF